MRWVLIALALLWAHEASAWEVSCRDLAAESPITRADIEDAICGRSPAALCEEGIGFGRGAHLGEHAWLTSEAMRAAGLGPSLTRNAFQTPQLGQGPFQPMGYWIDGESVLESQVLTFQPAGAGSMRRFLSRRVAIPEFSELPDGSHSIAEFVMGNEHCIPLNVPRGSEDQINRCHSFKGHMGAVNSTHWPPLSRAMYDLYHRLALDTAGRCSRMMEAVPSGHLLAGYMREAAKACEREALIYQSVASHYLEDAWATGHMFERWGSPEFARTPVEQLQNSVAALATGMIHGARALTGIHDRANMPGSSFNLLELDDANAIRYHRGQSESGSVGGGDLYLLECNQHRPGWFVGGGPPLRHQFLDMTTCLVRGFVEVYDAGPQTLGALATDLTLNSEITASTAAQCWDNRLTNHSMKMSVGISAPLPVIGATTTVTAEDLANPRWVVRYGLGRGVSEVRGSRELDVSDPEFDRESRRFRVGLGRLATAYMILSESSPNELHASRMLGRTGGPSSFFRNVFGDGTPARWSGHFVDAIERDQIAHFEDHDISSWSPAPASSLPCVTDAHCDDFPGTYCDRNVVELDRIVSRCVPQEAALLRAFRAAETPRWCRVQTWDSLNAARRACQAAATGASSPECRACVQVILPRMRNACDPGSKALSPGPGELDGRSICDIYHSAGSGLFTRQGTDGFVHVPYEKEGTESADTAAFRAALIECLAGPKAKVTNSFTRSYESGPGDAFIHTLSTRFAGFDHFEGTCGRDNGVHWDRVIHTADAPSGNVEITLTPAQTPLYPYSLPVADLELAVFQGPACTTRIAIESGADAPAGATRLATSWIVTQGVADEICIRVRPLSSLARGGHTLGIHRR